MSFELIKKGSRSTKPRMRAWVKGVSLNMAARELIGNPEYVDVLVDKVGSKIAVRASTRDKDGRAFSAGHCTVGLPHLDGIYFAEPIHSNGMLIMSTKDA